ncbi:MAG: LytTR family DNA-binding domain-containing protein [Cyclobacteriaceae bacterium]
MDDLIKILIVDDEPEARELIHYMLKGLDQVSVAGMAGHVDEALDLLKKKKADLIFLDIQMPDKDGFHFIELIHEAGYDPGIVFVTAYEHYAIQAIRNSVFDYILKPVRREELIRAIERFRSQKNRDPREEIGELIELLKQSATDKVKLNTRAGYMLVNPGDVVYCEADGNYTYLQMTSGSRELITQNLGSLEDLLQGSSFFRASRSYLVNLKYLSRVDRKTCNCHLEYPGGSCAVKIPAQKIRLLESSFS